MLKDLPMMLKEGGYSAVIVFGSPREYEMQYYVTGGADIGNVQVVIRDDGERFLFYNNLEEAAARRIRGFSLKNFNERFQIHQQEIKEDMLKGLAHLFRDRIVEDAGIVADNPQKPVIFYLKESLRTYYPIIRNLEEKWRFAIDWDYRNDPINDVRETKDSGEVERIRKLCSAVSDVHVSVMRWLAPFNEKEGYLVDRETGEYVTAEDMRTRYDEGIRSKGFAIKECGIGIGPGSANPHAVRDDTQKIPVDTPIMIDISPKEGNIGYRCDFTRTFVIGTAPQKVREIYRHVIGVRNELLSRAKTGMKSRDVQSMAYDLFEERGFETNRGGRVTKQGFNHLIGHGVGLDLYERPLFRTYLDDTLKPHNVLAIEPALYLSGEFGVRIENTYHIGEDGRFENLTEASEELVVS